MLSEDRVYDVIVVGGGIAGLTAACALLEEGADCLLLEASDYPGGRARTVRYGDLYAEAGAMVFTDEEHETLDLLRRYSKAPFIELGAHGAEMFLGGSLLRLNRLDGKVGSLRDLGELIRLASACRAAAADGFPKPTLSLLRAHRRLIGVLEERAAKIEYPYSPDAAEGWDSMSFADFVRPIHAGLIPFLDLQLKVTAGELSERISLFWGLVTAHWNADRFYWLRGGTSGLPDALAGRLGDRFVASCPVEEAAQGDPVRVRARLAGGAASLRCRQLVVATTPRAAAGILPDAPAWKREALEAVPFGVYIAVHLCCPERFWEGAVRSGYLNCAGTTCADLVDGTKAQPGASGILIGFVAGPEARGLRDASDGEIAARVKADVERIFPGSGPKIEQAFVYRWPEGIPYFPPHYADTLRRLRQSWGRIHFCGDYTQGAGMHDAVLSGLAAAASVRASAAAA